ncbi:GNAT family N-acetyltransferase [Caldithrix abyssi]|nr:GNAT family N-acetyltransferase [Caldithrix abyssi]
MNIFIADKNNLDELLPVFRELEEYYFGDDAASLSDIREYFESKVFSSHSGVQVVLAKKNGIVVGFATFTILYPAPKLSGQAYMKDLFTSTSQKGSGVGKQLMKFVAAYAIEHGCNRLDWTAEKNNPIAGQFYQAIGASVIEDKQYYRIEGSQLEQFIIAT